ncbi:MAG: hypothetical protein ACREEM_37885 [Blastocatellia bacterium]
MEVEHLAGDEITIAGAIREGAQPRPADKAAVAELKAKKIEAQKFTLAGRIDQKDSR